MTLNARSLTGARRRLSLALPAAVLGLTLFGGSGDALAQGREAFRRGIDLFEQGRYAEARAELEKFLAESPSSEVALEARNEAGYQVFVEMLARRDDIASIARKILELAERGDAKDRQDPEKIQSLIDAMFSEDEEASYRAIEELASRVGPFCVPPMVKHLAERRDNEKRVKAIVLLSKLGPDGSNAVIALLRHEDDFVRQNAAAILGHIRDFKAIPFLKSLVERRGESPQVQATAAQALRSITGKDVSALDPAGAYFLALGERYYREDPSVMVNNFKEWTVWEWKEEKLQFRIVPRWQWNEEMAEDCCYAAIAHGEHGELREGDLDGIYTLLVSSFFQQAVECGELLAVAEEKAAAGELDSAEVDALRGAKSRYDALPILAASRGEAQIAKALRKALKDRRPSLAVALIEALRDLRMSDGLLPADGANLASYLEDDSAARRPLEAAPAAPRPVEPARPAASEPEKPAPAPAPAAPPRKEEPATQPREETPEEKAKPGTGSRRRRVSRAPSGPNEELLASLPHDEPETIRTLQGSGEAHGASLAAALAVEDKRVRYAAAEALLRLAPTRKFANSAKVVENLAAAVQESGSRVVLVAAKDVQVRNRLLGLLRQMNHLPIGVPTAREALIRARSSPADDAVIIHTELNVAGDASDLTIAQFIEQIGADYRTRGTPVFVAAPRRSIDTYERSMSDKAKAVIPDDVDAVVLKEKLDLLWGGGEGSTGGGPRDPKTRATSVARMAAEAIAAADIRTSVFDLRGTIPGLMIAVETQPDSVRVPALRALGTLRARESVDKVAAIFDNAQNAIEVRAAAAYALGESLRGTAAPTKVFESLLGGLKEGDASLYKACAEALGKCNLSRDQARAVLLQQRVE